MFHWLHAKSWTCHQVDSLFQDIWAQRTSHELYDSHLHERNHQKSAVKIPYNMIIYQKVQKGSNTVKIKPTNISLREKKHWMWYNHLLPFSPGKNLIKILKAKKLCLVCSSKPSIDLNKLDTKIRNWKLERVALINC